ncbi:MAG: hypothetical protein V9G15_06145 [Dermatophilaceae bacterium]
METLCEVVLARVDTNRCGDAAAPVRRRRRLCVRRALRGCADRGGVRCERRERSRGAASRGRGRAGARGSHVLGRALGDDATAVRARAGAEIDHPVGGADDVEIVIDDDDARAHRSRARRARRSRARTSSAWRPAVGSSRSTSDAGHRLGEGARELEALRLAAGERGERLAEREVAEAELLRAGRARARSRFSPAKATRASSTVIARTSATERPSSFTSSTSSLEAAAAAARARERDVGEELHLDRLEALARARLAAAAGHVEREARRGEIEVQLLGARREHRADAVPRARVRRGVAAGGAPERGLIDEGRG